MPKGGEYASHKNANYLSVHIFLPTKIIAIPAARLKFLPIDIGCRRTIGIARTIFILFNSAKYIIGEIFSGERPARGIRVTLIYAVSNKTLTTSHTVFIALWICFNGFSADRWPNSFVRSKGKYKGHAYNRGCNPKYHEGIHHISFTLNFINLLIPRRIEKMNNNSG